MNEFPQEAAPMALPMQESAREEFERWRFNIDDLLMEKEYNLLGYFWNKSAKDGEGAWEQRGEARVNEKGAKAIISSMGGVVNKISTLTQLDIDEIMMQSKMLAMNLNRLFFLHHEDYAIKSPSDAQALLWEIVWFAFNGLKQSEGAAAMKSLADSGQTMRHVYMNQGEQQKGGFLHLPGRGKGEK